MGETWGIIQNLERDSHETQGRNRRCSITVVQKGMVGIDVMERVLAQKAEIIDDYQREKKILG